MSSLSEFEVPGTRHISSAASNTPSQVLKFAAKLLPSPGAMRVGLALTFLLTSVTFACDICKAPQRSAGDDAGESVLELSLDSLESVVEVHSLVVLLLYDDRTAARQRLQSFARAAAALKELETGDELETGESVVLGRIDVASYAEVAHRLEVCRMPSRTPHASCRMQFCTPHAAHVPRPTGAVCQHRT